MIRFAGISVRFEDRLILEDFDLEIQTGEKVLLFGKSGIGKSTIIKLILGFVFPESGEIFLDGKKLDKKTIWDIRKKIAYVNQNLEIGEGKVIEQIKNTLDFKSNSQIKFDIGKIKKLFEYFELDEEFLEKKIEELSGGEKQRIAIIFAILLEREIYLLDEVTAALDEKLKQKIAEYFTENENLTVLVISHDREWLDNKKVKVINLEEVQE